MKIVKTVENIFLSIKNWGVPHPGTTAFREWVMDLTCKCLIYNSFSNTAHLQSYQMVSKYDLRMYITECEVSPTFLVMQDKDTE